jgi:hypothetical protein
MKIAAAMLRQWHREDPARLLQAALWQAERLAQMPPELEALRVQSASLAAPCAQRANSSIAALARAAPLHMRYTN